jgi:hypothetical protein
MGRVNEPSGDDVTRRWIKLNNEELQNVYFSPRLFGRLT